jgi:hypothetical protein
VSGPFAHTAGAKEAILFATRGQHFTRWGNRNIAMACGLTVAAVGDIQKICRPPPKWEAMAAENFTILRAPSSGGDHRPQHRM